MAADRMTAPPRGTRPRNRPALIIAAATDLFYQRGFDQVSMGDIAEAVAIGPSALYRHFAGKQELLCKVIAAGLAPLQELLIDPRLPNTDTPLLRLATVALDNRQVGMLWQREARHMSASDYASLHQELRDSGRALTERLRTARPAVSAVTADLIAWSMMSVLMSASFHDLALPRPGYDGLLADLLNDVLSTDLPNIPPTADAPRGQARIAPRSRREALLLDAVRLFARDGYAGVSIEDIGAAVGIAGASVYNHFSSKRDMLVTALNRGTAVLFMDLADIYRTMADAPDGLRRLVTSYVRFALHHHDLVDLLITETVHLPEADRRAARQAQHDYVSEWVHLLQAVHPGLDPITARIRTHAAQAIANNVSRTPHLRCNPAIPAALAAVCVRILCPILPPSPY